MIMKIIMKPLRKDTNYKLVTTSKKISKKQEKSLVKNKSNLELRRTVIEYALKFNGNPYVYGGTSLTKGTDCSGFVQSVFRDNEIILPRTSRDQAAQGKKVPLNKIQPADLLFYQKNGSINHVAIYIGNGKVIHASNPKYGIRITNYNYRTPCKAVSYIL